MQIGRPTSNDSLRFRKTNLSDSNNNTAPYSVAGTYQNWLDFTNKINVNMTPNHGSISLTLNLLGCFLTIRVRQ